MNYYLKNGIESWNSIKKLGKEKILKMKQFLEKLWKLQEIIEILSVQQTKSNGIIWCQNQTIIQKKNFQIIY